MYFVREDMKKQTSNLWKISEVFSTTQIWLKTYEAKFVFLILVTNLCIVCIWTSKNLLRYCKGKACRNDTEIGKMPHALSCPRMWKTRVERRKKKRKEGKLKRSSRQVFTPLTIGSNSKGSFLLNTIPYSREF
jgi:hypothetical protein